MARTASFPAGRSGRVVNTSNFRSGVPGPVLGLAVTLFPYK